MLDDIVLRGRQGLMVNFLSPRMHGSLINEECKKNLSIFQPNMALETFLKNSTDSGCSSRAIFWVQFLAFTAMPAVSKRVTATAHHDHSA